MSHILLLGAGFSRNWGGWLATEAFEYLLGHPRVLGNPHLVQLLWKHQPKGGFESVLADVQRGWNLEPVKHLRHLQDMQAAVESMFADMNEGYKKLWTIDFSMNVGRRVIEFLSKFDAIFTLNQDLLLERHYFPYTGPFLFGRKWNGVHMLGIKRLPSSSHTIPQANTWADCKCEL